MRESCKILTVARFQTRTSALGPGSRAVIWFHGCSFNCPGCIAAEMNASTDFARVEAESLLNTVLAVSGIEGVTLSGGDPFDQDLSALTFLVEGIRAGGLSVMCYTGRTLEQLRTGAKAGVHQRVLAAIDVLIDGLYVDALNDGSAWRGSSNQAIHFLTDRYAHLKSTIMDSRNRDVEVVLDKNAKLTITGIPPKGFMGRLADELHIRGLTMSEQATEVAR